jgi:hypothetical protein
MRSRIDKGCNTHLCEVNSGGGQGNGLTGVNFAYTINRAVKGAEAQFPGVDIKCIHDDMKLLGPSRRLLWHRESGQEEALTYLIQRLKDRGLTINEGKYQLLVHPMKLAP